MLPVNQIGNYSWVDKDKSGEQGRAAGYCSGKQWPEQDVQTESLLEQSLGLQGCTALGCAFLSPTRLRGHALQKDGEFLSVLLSCLFHPYKQIPLHWVMNYQIQTEEVSHHSPPLR